MNQRLEYKSEETVPAESMSLQVEDIIHLLEKVPPLWDLESYIAVNPFLGYTNQSFDKAMEYLEEMIGVELVPDRELLDGKKKFIPKENKKNRASYRLESLLGGFFASYTDKGVSYWANPWDDMSLWLAFKNWAKKDPLFRSLAGDSTQEKLANLPDEAGKACLRIIQTHSKMHLQGLEPLLFIMPGWASYFRKSTWHTPVTGDCDLMGYASILAFLYANVPGLFPVDESIGQKPGIPIHERLSNLKAKEKQYHTELLEKLKGNQPSKHSEEAENSPVKQKRARFLFCIDVRSESLRRHLESASERIETDGFAGFFGMPIGYKYWTGEEFSHSPALITPSYVFQEQNKTKVKKLLKTKSWVQKIKRTFPIGLQYVEGAGFLSVFGLLAKTIKKVQNSSEFRNLTNDDIAHAVGSLDQETQQAIAIGLLKHLGWTENFPDYLIITGHGSHTQNNPHEAGLSCGACAGQSGELSARFAAELLNLQTVRDFLKEQGIAIPSTTKFLGALHETVTDSISLYKEEDVDSDFLGELKGWMAQAQKANLKEKETSLGLDPKTSDKRAKDWAEVFPEGGLAGCAGFIIGSRKLTKGLNLQARTFLNTYDWKKDTDLGTLELLLTAPMVVASWINLQYYASTVSPDVFGAGNKLLHSIVGNMGVFEGNSWTLKTGLPLQSVYDGERFIHQPIRLNVFVESPIENIDKILSKHSAVQQLVDGGWVYMTAIDPKKGYLLRENGKWEKI